MSLTGLCLDAGQPAGIALLWKEAAVRLRPADDLLVSGKIVWVGKGGLIGVKVTDGGETTRSHIERYIIENAESSETIRTG